jgi:hypothetical protein
MHIPSFQQDPSYEQVSQELDEVNQPSSSTLPVRPPTYYGEGPFDPPSSDDEDERLLEKSRPLSPGGDQIEGGGAGLRIGGHKVCYFLSDFTLQLMFSSAASTIILAMSCHLTHFLSRSIRMYWHIRSRHLQRSCIPYTRRKAYNHGSYIQWNFLC